MSCPTQRGRSSTDQRAPCVTSRGVGERKKKQGHRRNVRPDTRELVCLRVCGTYKETLLRGRRRGAWAPAGPRDVNTPDVAKYFVVIVRDSSSTNTAGLKLSLRSRRGIARTSGRCTQTA
jgi:hypothetical protein